MKFAEGERGCWPWLVPGPGGADAQSGVAGAFGSFANNQLKAFGDEPTGEAEVARLDAIRAGNREPATTRAGAASPNKFVPGANYLETSRMSRLRSGP